MNNCLVTRLKGNVNDDTLLKLGEIKVEFLKTSIQTTGDLGDNFVINEDGKYTLSLEGGKFNASSQIEQDATSVTISSGVAVVGVDTVGAKMSIMKKYGITRWFERPASESVPIFKPWDISLLQYSSGLYFIKTHSAFGDISKLPKNNYTSLNFNFSGIYGNAEELTEGVTTYNTVDLQVRKCANITGNVENLGKFFRFVADNSGLSGSIEKWIEARMALGVTSTSQRHSLGGSKVKFINNLMSEGTYLWISYTSTTAEVAINPGGSAWVKYTGGVWYDHNGNPYTPQ